ncbi:MAG: hypothetical protein ACR2ND_13700 [Solirubrobacteraceae bacterium]
MAIGLLAAASPGQALALEPGVHVDPGSPAAKEYAFPLSSARGISGGSPGATAKGSPAAPALFGAGITRRSVQSRASSIGSTPGSARTVTPRGTAAVATAPGLSGPVLGEVHRLESPPPSDPINGSVAVLAAAVLGLGGLGAFALKRLRDRDERRSA